jgi:hypothetical protein
MSYCRKCFVSIVACLLLATPSSPGQSESRYQTGTVVEVKPHQAAHSDKTTKHYDVTVKVGDTLYTVLYTPTPGSKVVEYSAGMDRPVLIEGDNLKFNDLRGHSASLPIVSRKQVTKKASSTPGN